MSNQTLNLKIPIKESFNLIPRLANTIVSSNPEIVNSVPENVKDTEISIGVELDGESYGLCIKDGVNFELQGNGAGQPVVKVITGVSDIENLMIYENAAAILEGAEADIPRSDIQTRIDKITSAKGSLALELRNDDDSTSSLKIIFNGTEEPWAKVKLEVTDLRKVLSGERKAAGLFLTGGIKLEGDMGLSMMFQELLS